MEQVLLKHYSWWRTHGGAEEKSEEEEVAEENPCATAIISPTLPFLVPHIASLKRLSVTCSNKKSGGEEFGVKLDR